MENRQSKSENLETIPGIGRTIARNLRRIEIAKVSDFAGKDPERLYDLLACESAGGVGQGQAETVESERRQIK
ncbi:MAG: helix-hairpin-helix domain-containing protein [Bacteroidales bacterium]|jgi:hypothetical protein|nr:helix-hairpin-helix domain-containing protein [Bacteroidales bacterium]